MCDTWGVCVVYVSVHCVHMCMVGVCIYVQEYMCVACVVYISVCGMCVMCVYVYVWM